MIRMGYPFSAIVGQEQMKTALLVNAVDPGIGGVLISGHKGTGKSTAVRGLARLLPSIHVVKGCPYHCDPDAPDILHEECFERFSKGEQLPREKKPMPLVELPLNATEDRLVGALHVEQALQTGRRVFEPGLLAFANRGILYVDEVNLLDDHLVDMLLDAAASGVNIVEREGISFQHPARFILVGTMNPEEGALRPQFLDRFGLFVPIMGVEDIDQRQEIVRRHLAFEKNPNLFHEQWADAEKDIGEKIMNARKNLPSIILSEDMMHWAVLLAKEAGARGHRAEIAMCRASRALAALLGKEAAGEEEMARAARFVLPHRMPNQSLASPHDLLQTLDEVLARVPGKKKLKFPAPLVFNDKIDEGYPDEPMQVPGSAAAGSITFSPDAEPSERTFEADDTVCVRDIHLEEMQSRTHVPGRHEKKLNSSKTGRYIRSAPAGEQDKSFDVAVDATLRAAALRSSGNQDERVSPSPFSIQSEDYRKKVRQRDRNSLVIFVVDSSDSMGAAERMAAAKGAALALCRTAYQKRDRVALVCFRNERAETLLEPTNSVALVRERLKRLPTGGATPFADGLLKAWQIVRNERAKDPAMSPVMVIISDGEANVPLESGRTALEELLSLAQAIRLDRIHFVVIDTRGNELKSDNMKRLADSLNAQYHHIDILKTGNLVNAIKEAENF